MRGDPTTPPPPEAESGSYPLYSAQSVELWQRFLLGSCVFTLLLCTFLVAQQRRAAAVARATARADAHRGVAMFTHEELEERRKRAPTVLPMYVAVLFACAVLAAALTLGAVLSYHKGETSAKTSTVLPATAVQGVVNGGYVFVGALLSGRSLSSQDIRRAAAVGAVVAVLTALSYGGSALLCQCTHAVLSRTFQVGAQVAHVGLAAALAVCVWRAPRARRRAVVVFTAPLLVCALARIVVGWCSWPYLLWRGARPGLMYPQSVHVDIWVTDVAGWAQFALFPIVLFAALRIDTRYWRGIGRTEAVHRGMTLDDADIAALQPLLGGQRAVTWLASQPQQSRGHGVRHFAEETARRGSGSGASGGSGNGGGSGGSGPRSGDRNVGGATAGYSCGRTSGASGSGAAAGAAGMAGAASALAHPSRLADADADADADAGPIWYDWSDIAIGSRLSRGSYGSVHTGACRGSRVAIKVASPVTLEPVDVAAFVEEALWMHALHTAHPDNVVKLIGLFLRPPDLGFILELCDGGSLHGQLEKRAEAAAAAAGRAGDAAATRTVVASGSGRALPPSPTWTWTWSRCLDVAAQCADAVAALHSHDPPVVHRDLKSPNFLLTADGNVKLADFGLARVVANRGRDRGTGSGYTVGGAVGTGDAGASSGEALPAPAPVSAVASASRALSARGMTALVGSPLWMAPELITARESDRPMATEKVDVFSLGVVLWEIATSVLPYEGLRAHVVLGGVSRGTLRPTIPSFVPADYAAIMTAAWAQAPADRPSAAEVAAAVRRCAGGDWVAPVYGVEPSPSAANPSAAGSAAARACAADSGARGASASARASVSASASGTGTGTGSVAVSVVDTPGYSGRIVGQAVRREGSLQ